MKKLFTLFTMALTVSAAGAKQLYLCGDAPIGTGWDVDADHQVAMTLADDGITNTATFTVDGQKWFAVSDGPGSDWGDYNSNHRYGVGANVTTDLTEGGTYNLVLCQEPTFTVKPGTYTITINSETMEMTVKAEAAQRPDEDSYYVVGSSSEIFGASWNLEQTEPYMTKTAEGVYEWTKADVALSAGNIEWKVIVNPKFSGWGEQYGADGFGNNPSNIVTAIDEAGTYSITFKIDLSAGDATVPTAEVKGTSTGIHSVGTTATNGETFSLSGQRVAQPRHGIYIRNGKKYIAN